jgi:hypothetical protein
VAADLGDRHERHDTRERGQRLQPDGHRQRTPYRPEHLRDRVAHGSPFGARQDTTTNVVFI